MYDTWQPRVMIFSCCDSSISFTSAGGQAGQRLDENSSTTIGGFTSLALVDIGNVMNIREIISIFLIIEL